MAVRMGMRACGGFLAVASLAFLLLSICMPGIEWFGVDKRVVFTDATEDTSLEVSSSFHFGYLWTRQKIETEIDAVVFEENEYGWCAGTTPQMAPATQRALCGARRLMWACTAVYLLVGLLNTFLSCGAGAMASPRRSRNPRFLTHALTVLAAVQLLAGVALSWMWTGIKQGVEAYFTANYTETNTLVMRVGWSWYLAGFSGLATTLLLLLSLRLSCLAEHQARRHRHHRRHSTADAAPDTTIGAPATKPSKPPKPSSHHHHHANHRDSDPAAAVDDLSITTHSTTSDLAAGGIRPSTSLPSLGGGASSTNSSRASSRSSTPARAARAALVSHNNHQQQAQQEQERRYPQRHPPAEPQRALCHYS